MTDIIKRIRTAIDEGECQTNVWLLLDEAEGRIAELETALQEVPTDPYPADMCHIDSDEYVRLTPDPVTRTGISWYLMGEGYRVALKDFQRIRDELNIREQ